MDEMIYAISQYVNGSYLVMEWENAGLVLGGQIETIYQTDNGKPERVTTFREFYACAFRITRILKNLSANAYYANSLMEISSEAPPSRISLEDGTVIWSMPQLETEAE